MASAFGAFLHQVRKRTKGTQLAKAAGISYVYLLDLEKGARPVPSNGVLMSLADNLPFEPGERERFFDLAAEEAGGVPLDVAAYLSENKAILRVLRGIRDGDLSKDALCTLLEDGQSPAEP